MDRPKLLDLCCCAGGCSMGYYLAGFEVTGLDIKPQPHYPFRFIQGDALTADLSGYDAYHASPPCQSFSCAVRKVNRHKFANIIAQVRNRLVSIGKPFVIENVTRAPLYNYIKLSGTMFGLETIKERGFELHGFDVPLLLPPPIPNTRGMVKNGQLVGIMHKTAYPKIRTKRQDMAAAYRINWIMNRQELREAIPPAYTEFIGKYLLKEVTKSN